MNGMPKFGRRRQRGHNLLEMLLATVIFATAMISIASVYQYIAISVAKARDRIMGQYLAKGLMERCVAARFYNVIELDSVHPPPNASYPDVTMTFRKNGEIFQTVFKQEVQVDDSYARDSANAPIFTGLRGKLVRVKVTWEEKNRRFGSGKEPYAEYRTYIGENS